MGPVHAMTCSAGDYPFAGDNEICDDDTLGTVTPAAPSGGIDIEWRMWRVRSDPGSRRQVGERCKYFNVNEESCLYFAVDGRMLYLSN